MEPHDLMIPATPELLDGWCGPVRTNSGLAGPSRFVFLYRSKSRPGEAVCACRATGNVRGIPFAALFLDLARAECRDRVARVLRPSCQNGVELRFDGRSLYVGGHPSTRAWYEAQGLDRDDDTRLPDGSRLVDALALAAVWRAREGGSEC